MSITRASLEALFCMRQVHAAEHLEISLTALKNACKSLGIDRWPYSKGPTQGIATPCQTAAFHVKDSPRLSEGKEDEDEIEDKDDGYVVNVSTEDSELLHVESHRPLELDQPDSDHNMYIPPSWSPQDLYLEPRDSNPLMAESDPPEQHDGDSADEPMELTREWIEWFVGLAHDDPTIDMDVDWT
ncbi:hypothetical protein GUITHDRAFT_118123 [Guillardia theta CCMP2712]|uniref:RWP-RK domain-containing protein n=1 Tax=Guillardia theta (strain CCMP2712) TaxID=905079 RepID=L1IHL8_GUITC|nr:hypothetical protein GUITHDRAFT_118123 [Guillardia theta CCMP2712]EKX35738.1 hypothetical protein GUITHDRAFT_118123 [Guillardia theta CCMP2712]|eukprot:XP_005822718.1 hypothetical protein GUITHDRAFT_118123 [Guillardia theta CCMP2712]